TTTPGPDYDIGLNYDSSVRYHHVAAVYASSQSTQIYVDGVNIGAIAARAPTWFWDRFVVGKSIICDPSGTSCNYNYGEAIDATFDDLQIYTRVLNAEEIAQLAERKTWPQRQLILETPAAALEWNRGSFDLKAAPMLANYGGQISIATS